MYILVIYNLFKLSPIDFDDKAKKEKEKKEKKSLYTAILTVSWTEMFLLDVCNENSTGTSTHISFTLVYFSDKFFFVNA